jgi:sugar lactone lactonase YvrE
MKSAPLFSSPAQILFSITMAAGIAAAQVAQTAPPTPVGSTSAVQTATVYVTAKSTIGSINVLTQGVPNLDFQLASGGTCTVGATYLKGQSCTVNYTFNPMHPGIRYGAAVLYDNASPANAAGTRYLKGLGNGPQVAFTPPAESTFASGDFYPGSVAADGAGNIFFIERSTSEVVSLNEFVAAGGYTTVKTTLDFLPSCIAIDGSGNLFATDEGSPALREITAASGYTTVRTLTNALTSPKGVAVDASGNVFVADHAGQAVREIQAAGDYTTVKTIATGTIRPGGIAVDRSGNVFFGDDYTLTVKEILASGGYTTVQTIGSKYGDVNNIALDGNGNVFLGIFAGVAYPTQPVKEILAQGGYTTTKLVANLPCEPGNLALDGNGNIFVAMIECNRFDKLDVSDSPSLGFASTTVGSTSSDSPKQATVLNNGNQTLSFSNVSYPPDFPEKPGVATDCKSATKLTAGNSCTLSVNFSPLVSSATGPSTVLSEDVSLTDDDLNVADAMQSVAASGTATFTPPVLTTPTPGSTLAGSTVTFAWTPGSAATFKFQVGYYRGGNGIYGSGQTTKTSETVNNLPTNGETIHARLYYLVGSTWQFTDYTHTAQ